MFPNQGTIAGKSWVLQDDVKVRPDAPVQRINTFDYSSLVGCKQRLIIGHYEKYSAENAEKRVKSVLQWIARELNDVPKPNLVNEIHKKILFLHDYNLQVTKETKSYPKSGLLRQLLLKYVKLEMEVLHSMTCRSDANDKIVEDRIVRLLMVIFRDHCYNERKSQEKLRRQALTDTMNLLCQVNYLNIGNHQAAPHKVDYFLEKIVNKLVTKLDHLDIVNQYMNTNLAYNRDSQLCDKDVVHLSKVLTAGTSDYGSDESEQDNTSNPASPTHETEEPPSRVHQECCNKIFEVIPLQEPSSMHLFKDSSSPSQERCLSIEKALSNEDIPKTESPTEELCVVEVKDMKQSTKKEDDDQVQVVWQTGWVPTVSLIDSDNEMMSWQKEAVSLPRKPKRKKKKSKKQRARSKWKNGNEIYVITDDEDDVCVILDDDEDVVIAQSQPALPPSTILPKSSPQDLTEDCVQCSVPTTDDIRCSLSSANNSPVIKDLQSNQIENDGAIERLQSEHRSAILLSDKNIDSEAISNDLEITTEKELKDSQHVDNIVEDLTKAIQNSQELTTTTSLQSMREDHIQIETVNSTTQENLNIQPDVTETDIVSEEGEGEKLQYKNSISIPQSATSYENHSDEELLRSEVVVDKQDIPVDKTDYSSVENIVEDLTKAIQESEELTKEILISTNKPMSEEDVGENSILMKENREVDDLFAVTEENQSQGKGFCEDSINTVESIEDLIETSENEENISTEDAAQYEEITHEVVEEETLNTTVQKENVYHPTLENNEESTHTEKEIVEGKKVTYADKETLEVGNEEMNSTLEINKEIIDKKEESATESELNEESVTVTNAADEIVEDKNEEISSTFDINEEIVNDKKEESDTPVELNESVTVTYANEEIVEDRNEEVNSTLGVNEETVNDKKEESGIVTNASDEIVEDKNEEISSTFEINEDIVNDKKEESGSILEVNDINEDILLHDKEELNEESVEISHINEEILRDTEDGHPEQMNEESVAPTEYEKTVENNKEECQLQSDEKIVENVNKEQDKKPEANSPPLYENMEGTMRKRIVEETSTFESSTETHKSTLIEHNLKLFNAQSSENVSEIKQVGRYNTTRDEIIEDWASDLSEPEEQQIPKESQLDEKPIEEEEIISIEETAITSQIDDSVAIEYADGPEVDDLFAVTEENQSQGKGFCEDSINTVERIEDLIKTSENKENISTEDAAQYEEITHEVVEEETLNTTVQKENVYHPTLENNKKSTHTDGPVKIISIEETAITSQIDDSVAIEDADGPAKSISTEETAITSQIDDSVAIEDADGPAKSISIEETAITSQIDDSVAIEDADGPAKSISIKETAITSQIDDSVAIEDADGPAKSNSIEETAITSQIDDSVAIEDADGPVKSVSIEETAITSQIDDSVAIEDADGPAKSNSIEETAITSQIDDNVAIEDADGPAKIVMPNPLWTLADVAEIVRASDKREHPKPIDDSENRRVTRSQKSIILSQTNDYKPHDFIPTYEETTVTPPTNKVYKERMHDVNTYSEDSNDSGAGKLLIDEGNTMEASAKQRNVYDEDTLEDNLIFHNNGKAVIEISIPESEYAVNNDPLLEQIDAMIENIEISQKETEPLSLSSSQKPENISQSDGRKSNEDDIPLSEVKSLISDDNKPIKKVAEPFAVPTIETFQEKPVIKTKAALKAYMKVDKIAADVKKKDSRSKSCDSAEKLPRQTRRPSFDVHNLRSMDTKTEESAASVSGHYLRNSRSKLDEIAEKKTKKEDKPNVLVNRKSTYDSTITKLKRKLEMEYQKGEVEASTDICVDDFKKESSIDSSEDFKVSVPIVVDDKKDDKQVFSLPTEIEETVRPPKKVKDIKSKEVQSHSLMVNVERMNEKNLSFYSKTISKNIVSEEKVDETLKKSPKPLEKVEKLRGRRRRSEKSDDKPTKIDTKETDRKSRSKSRTEEAKEKLKKLDETNKEDKSKESIEVVKDKKSKKESDRLIEKSKNSVNEEREKSLRRNSRTTKEENVKENKKFSSEKVKDKEEKSREDKKLKNYEKEQLSKLSSTLEKTVKENEKDKNKTESIVLDKNTSKNRESKRRKSKTDLNEPQEKDKETLNAKADSDIKISEKSKIKISKSREDSLGKIDKIVEKSKDKDTKNKKEKEKQTKEEPVIEDKNKKQIIAKSKKNPDLNKDNKNKEDDKKENYIKDKTKEELVIEDKSKQQSITKSKKDADLTKDKKHKEDKVKQPKLDIIADDKKELNFKNKSKQHSVAKSKKEANLNKDNKNKEDKGKQPKLDIIVDDKKEPNIKNKIKEEPLIEDKSKQHSIAKSKKEANLNKNNKNKEDKGKQPKLDIIVDDKKETSIKNKTKEEPVIKDTSKQQSIAKFKKDPDFNKDKRNENQIKDNKSKKDKEKEAKFDIFVDDKKDTNIRNKTKEEPVIEDKSEEQIIAKPKEDPDLNKDQRNEKPQKSKETTSRELFIGQTKMMLQKSLMEVMRRTEPSPVKAVTQNKVETASSDIGLKKNYMTKKHIIMRNISKEEEARKQQIISNVAVDDSNKTFKRTISEEVTEETSPIKKIKLDEEVSVQTAVEDKKLGKSTDPIVDSDEESLTNVDMNDVNVKVLKKKLNEKLSGTLAVKTEDCGRRRKPRKQKNCMKKVEEVKEIIPENVKVFEKITVNNENLVVKISDSEITQEITTTVENELPLISESLEVPPEKNETIEHPTENIENLVAPMEAESTVEIDRSHSPILEIASKPKMEAFNDSIPESLEVEVPKEFEPVEIDRPDSLTSEMKSTPEIEAFDASISGSSEKIEIPKELVALENKPTSSESLEKSEIIENIIPLEAEATTSILEHLETEVIQEVAPIEAKAVMSIEMSIAPVLESVEKIEIIQEAVPMEVKAIQSDVSVEISQNNEPILEETAANVVKDGTEASHILEVSEQHVESSPINEIIEDKEEEVLHQENFTPEDIMNPTLVNEEVVIDSSFAEIETETDQTKNDENNMVIDSNNLTQGNKMEETATHACDSDIQSEEIGVNDNVVTDVNDEMVVDDKHKEVAEEETTKVTEEVIVEDTIPNYIDLEVKTSTEENCIVKEQIHDEKDSGIDEKLAEGELCETEMPTTVHLEEEKSDKTDLSENLSSPEIEHNVENEEQCVVEETHENVFAEKPNDFQEIESENAPEASGNFNLPESDNMIPENLDNVDSDKIICEQVDETVPSMLDSCENFLIPTKSESDSLESASTSNLTSVDNSFNSVTSTEGSFLEKKSWEMKYFTSPVKDLNLYDRKMESNVPPIHSVSSAMPSIDATPSMMTETGWSIPSNVTKGPLPVPLLEDSAFGGLVEDEIVITPKNLPLDTQIYEYLSAKLTNEGLEKASTVNLNDLMMDAPENTVTTTAAALSDLLSSTINSYPNTSILPCVSSAENMHILNKFVTSAANMKDHYVSPNVVTCSKQQKSQSQELVTPEGGVFQFEDRGQSSALPSAFLECISGSSITNGDHNYDGTGSNQGTGSNEDSGANEDANTSGDHTYNTNTFGGPLLAGTREEKTILSTSFQDKSTTLDTVEYPLNDNNMEFSFMDMLNPPDDDVNIILDNAYAVDHLVMLSEQSNTSTTLSNYGLGGIENMPIMENMSSESGKDSMDSNASDIDDPTGKLQWSQFMKQQQQNENKKVLVLPVEPLTMPTTHMLKNELISSYIGHEDSLVKSEVSSPPSIDSVLMTPTIDRVLSPPPIDPPQSTVPSPPPAPKVKSPSPTPEEKAERETRLKRMLHWHKSLTSNKQNQKKRATVSEVPVRVHSRTKYIPKKKNIPSSVSAPSQVSPEVPSEVPKQYNIKPRTDLLQPFVKPLGTSPCDETRQEEVSSPIACGSAYDIVKLRKRTCTAVSNKLDDYTIDSILREDEKSQKQKQQKTAVSGKRKSEQEHAKSDKKLKGKDGKEQKKRDHNTEESVPSLEKTSKNKDGNLLWNFDKLTAPDERSKTNKDDQEQRRRRDTSAEKSLPDLNQRTDKRSNSTEQKRKADEKHFISDDNSRWSKSREAKHKEETLNSDALFNRLRDEVTVNSVQPSGDYSRRSYPSSYSSSSYHERDNRHSSGPHQYQSKTDNANSNRYSFSNNYKRNSRSGNQHSNQHGSQHSSSSSNSRQRPLPPGYHGSSRPSTYQSRSSVNHLTKDRMNELLSNLRQKVTNPKLPARSPPPMKRVVDDSWREKIKDFVNTPDNLFDVPVPAGPAPSFTMDNPSKKRK